MFANISAFLSIIFPVKWVYNIYNDSSEICAGSGVPVSRTTSRCRRLIPCGPFSPRTLQDRAKLMGFKIFTNIFKTKIDNITIVYFCWKFEAKCLPKIIKMATFSLFGLGCHFCLAYGDGIIFVSGLVFGQYYTILEFMLVQIWLRQSSRFDLFFASL